METRIASLVAAFIGVACSLCSALPLAQTTDTFLANHGQARAMVTGERVAAMYGNVLAQSNVGETPEQLGNRFMLNDGDALGVDGLTYDPLGCITIKNGEMVVCSYRQKVGGLPVYSAITRVVIIVGPPHKIGFIATRLSQPPAGGVAGAGITEAQAKAVVEGDPLYDDIDPATFSAAEEVVYEASDGNVYRAWSFTGSGGVDEPKGYRFLVDSGSATIIAALNLVFEASVSGTVTGNHRPCCDANEPAFPDCCAADTPPETAPVADALVQVIAEAGPVCPDTSGAVLAYTHTAADGSYALPDVPTNSRVVTYLSGPWATVFHCPQAPFSCDNQMDQGLLDPVSLCLPFSSQVDFEFNPSPYTDEDTAHVSAFVAVSRTHEWITALQPQFNGVDLSLPVLTNVHFLNGYYESGRRLMRLGFSNNVLRNLAFQVIVSHEYGHFILDSLLLPDTSDLEQTSFHEGIADTVASLLWNTPYMGLGIFTSGTPEYLRRLDEPDVRLNDCASQPQWCANCNELRAPHCPGLALGGAFWDLRTKLMFCSGGETTLCDDEGDCAERSRCIDGTCHEPCETDADCGVSATCSDADTERLFADFLFITDGHLDNTVLAELLAADDDDANLCNDSPNKTEILSAFRAHGWTWDNTASCEPESEIAVGWDVLGETPQMTNGDFSINTRLDPPHVLLHSTRTGQGQLISRWFIGCSADEEACDIGRISAEWAGPMDQNITVQVGDTTNSLYRVATVHIVDISRQSDTNWSNIVLSVEEGGVTGRAQCNASTAGLGGRISGETAQGVSRVIARAVGIGENTGGILAAGQKLGHTVLGSLPGDSSMSAAVLDGDLRISGDLSGKLGFSAIGLGKLMVDGDIAGDVMFGEIPYTTGWIVADADGADGGSITGSVVVSGTFEGNICGDNLSASEPLPPNIYIGELGASARVCGSTRASSTNCATAAPLAPQAEPTPIPKNRFISFKPGNSGYEDPYAIRVAMPSLHHPASQPSGGPAPAFSEFENQWRYVNTFKDVSGNPVFICDDNPTWGTTFACATLGCSPEYRDWTADFGDAVIHVTAPEIVPDSEYSVQLISSQCWANVSPPLAIYTSRWGDVVGTTFSQPPNGIANAIDVAAGVDKVRGLATARPEPQLMLNKQLPTPVTSRVNAADLARVVDAVKGLPYPFGMCPCPSEVFCGTPCSECEQNSPCAGDGCRDACGRCQAP